VDCEEREDLAQEYALERAKAAAEGRSPRPRAWVEADYWRRLRGRNGRQSRTARVSLSELDLAAPAGRDDELRKTILERALFIARGLPQEQRAPIEAALSIWRHRLAEDRVRAWLEGNPGHVATHREIARDCGLARETVTRLLSRLRGPIGSPH
jgi:CRP-like cAMP-binding protein